MAVLRILSHSGDTRITWDQAAWVAEDPQALEAVREAEAIFAQARACGGSAFSLLPDRHAVAINGFDPELEHIVVIPRFMGG